MNVWASLDALMQPFEPWPEGGGVGSSRSNFKKGLIQPAHDWCMSVLRLIPMDGRSVTTGLKGLFFRFIVGSATDRFPLAVQGLIIEAKFNRLTAFAWVACGLGTNVFSCQTSRDSRRLGSVRAVSFVLLPANRWDSCLLGRSSRFAITSLCGTARRGKGLSSSCFQALSSVMISWGSFRCGSLSVCYLLTSWV